MKLSASAIVFLLLSSALFGQFTRQRSHVVEMSKGDSHVGKSLIYEKPIMKEPVFRLDDRLVMASKVKFFKNNNGYFTNLTFANEPSPGDFAMRIKKGNIDLYETIDIEVYGQESLQVTEQQHKSGEVKLATGDKFQYYSVDKKRVKKANYQNLRLDMATNAKAAENMQMFRRYQWLQRGLIAGGISLVAGGIATQTGDPVFTPVIALGAVAVGSSWFCRAPKHDYLWEAVDAYNE